MTTPVPGEHRIQLTPAQLTRLSALDAEIEHLMAQRHAFVDALCLSAIDADAKGYRVKREGSALVIVPAPDAPAPTNAPTSALPLSPTLQRKLARR